MKQWIKLYIEILDDPKMGRMSDRLFRRAIELFLMAGRSGNDGVLPPVDDLAWILRIEETTLVEDLHSLAAVGIVHEQEPGIWVVTNFAERQDADTSAERIANYRKQKRVTKRYSTRNDDVTKRYNNSNEHETKRYGDKEEEVEEDKEEEVEEEVDADAKNSGGNNSDDITAYFSPEMQPLIEAFTATTGIYAPVGGGGRTKRWHDAMIELMRMRASPEEITATCTEMLGQGLKIAGPWSIVNGLNVYRSRQRAPNGKNKNTPKPAEKQYTPEQIYEALYGEKP
ncbi:hypothetical protein BECAL_01771 [Bellilinea caldifistulae]|uniref:Phage replisome organiser N-terminal domain-containing protein n=1 Tax=Bellilinea caldifistulae TaxID=360411 RepID=A0A0P6XIY3_9CHLR|nr:hypothetical protein [Bellilinea caldifistulae]KPL74963.1 hypothetical protein AC812_10635 [Bellilinea caldifistulae]GAP10598.1 hypothetical protein BECAL_01771 [Bellilinea caldifistulae]